MSTATAPQRDDTPQWSDHAMIERWDERTPVDSPAPETAFARGEDLEHHEMFTSGRPGSAEIHRARVYHDPDGWAVVLLVHRQPDGTEMVVTVLQASKMSNGKRGYVLSHGPHGGSR